MIEGLYSVLNYYYTPYLYLTAVVRARPHGGPNGQPAAKCRQRTPRIGTGATSISAAGTITLRFSSKVHKARGTKVHSFCVRLRAYPRPPRSRHNRHFQVQWNESVWVCWKRHGKCHWRNWQKQQRTLVNVKPSGECVFGAVAAAIGGETGAQLKQHLLDSIGPVYGAFTPHLHS